LELQNHLSLCKRQSGDFKGLSHFAQPEKAKRYLTPQLRTNLFFKALLDASHCFIDGLIV
jgi:hypothetical protein